MCLPPELAQRKIIATFANYCLVKWVWSTAVSYHSRSFIVIWLHFSLPLFHFPVRMSCRREVVVHNLQCSPWFLKCLLSVTWLTRGELLAREFNDGINVLQLGNTSWKQLVSGLFILVLLLEQNLRKKKICPTDYIIEGM